MPMHLIITFDDDCEIDAERLTDNAADFDQFDIAQAITALAELMEERISDLEIIARKSALLVGPGGAK
jgi:hypothetical protein